MALDELGGEAPLTSVSRHLMERSDGRPFSYRSSRSFEAAVRYRAYRHCPDSSLYRGGFPAIDRVGKGLYALSPTAKRALADDRDDSRDSGLHDSVAAMHWVGSVPLIDQTISVKPSNVRFLDLVVAFAALMLAPGVGPAAVSAKLLPTIARMVDVLKDDEALVVRVLAELAPPMRKVAETEIVGASNAHLRARGRSAWNGEKVRGVLEKLAEKECVEPVVSPSRAWRLRQPVFVSAP